MARPSNRTSILRGAQFAARELAAMGYSPDDPVDVFSAIERARLRLMFQPLEAIKGALCTVSSGTTGVLVNANHPLHLQRFTAAHELGHFRLGHKEAVDLLEDDVAGDMCRLSGTELEAESFASYFLMPERALRRAFDSSRPILPEDAYQVSLRLQVSYRAMVSRLYALKMVSYSQAEKLRTVQPKDIKRSLTHGLTGNLGRRHVWLIRTEDARHLVRPAVGDEIHVLLPENPSAGYSWREVESSDAPVRRVATDSHFANDLFGASNERHIAYEVVDAREGRLALSHSRSWQDSSESESFELQLKVEGSPAAGEGRGLTHSQLDLIAARGQ